MAVTVGTIVSASGAAVTTLSSPSANASAGSNPCLVVGTSSSSATAQVPTGVTWDVGTPENFTAGPSISGLSFFGASLWRLVGFTQANDTATATFGGTADDCSIGLIEFEGVDQTTPIGNTGTDSGSDAAPSVTLTGMVTGDMAVDAFGLDNSASSDNTPGADQTERIDRTSTGSYPMSLAMSTQTETGGVMTYTTTGAGVAFMYAAMVLKQAAAGSDASGDITLPQITIAGTADIEYKAAGTIDLPQVTIGGAASVEYSAVGNVNLPAITVNGIASHVFDGAGAITLPSLVVDGAAIVTYDAAGSIVLPIIEVNGAAEIEYTAVGAVTLPLVTVNGVATVGDVIGASGQIQLPALTVNGAASVALAAAGQVTLPAVTVSGAASGPVPPVFSGTIPDITGNQGDADITTDLSVFFTGATSYSIAPALESGWNLNTVTGLLTVDTDDVGSFGPYIVTGTNASGSDDSNAFSVVISEAADALADPGSKYRKPHPAWLEMQERLRKEYALEIAKIRGDSESVIDAQSIQVNESEVKTENYIQDLIGKRDLAQHDIAEIYGAIESLETDSVVIVDREKGLEEIRIFLEAAKQRELKINRWIAVLQDVIEFYFY